MPHDLDATNAAQHHAGSATEELTESGSWIQRMTNQEQLNFLLTNRIPRRSLTLLMGWFSRIESPLIARISIWIWQRFADDLRLHESATQEFRSLRDCFTRRLKPGARPVDPRTHVITSPCDAIIGESGPIDGNELIQAKGFPYTLDDLVCDSQLAAKYRNGRFITLRLKSSMYHRFHAPCDCGVDGMSYLSGDTWNVNPIALKRIEKLFCKNERAVIDLQLDGQSGAGIALVPVAAVLVASMQFDWLDEPLTIQYRGPNHIAASANFRKGDEMGYFQHGSTIIVLTTSDYRLFDTVQSGNLIRMGQPLMTRADTRLRI